MIQTIAFRILGHQKCLLLRFLNAFLRRYRESLVLLIRKILHFPSGNYTWANGIQLSKLLYAPYGVPQPFARQPLSNALAAVFEVIARLTG
jgi:hypothetical protein